MTYLKFQLILKIFHCMFLFIIIFFNISTKYKTSWIALCMSLCDHLSYSFSFLGRWLSFHTLQLQCNWIALGMDSDASWSSYSLSWRSSCDKWNSLHNDIICRSINCQKSFNHFKREYFKKLIFWIWKKFVILTLFSQFCWKFFCDILLCGKKFFEVFLFC